MKPKPGHLGLKYTEQFKYISLVDVYHYHRPYPDDAISKLVKLVSEEPRTILDLGCVSAITPLYKRSFTRPFGRGSSKGL